MAGLKFKVLWKISWVDGVDQVDRARSIANNRDFYASSEPDLPDPPDLLIYTKWTEPRDLSKNQNYSLFQLQNLSD